MSGEWTDERREELRERNRRRGWACSRCGGPLRELSPTEQARRFDLFASLRYRACGGCGAVYPVRPRARRPRRLP